VRSGLGKTAKNKKKKKENKSTVVSSKKKSTVMTHPAPNEKMQPIQWTERPTGALVAVDSLCPASRMKLRPPLCNRKFQFRKWPPTILGNFLQVFKLIEWHDQRK
jgi:hypothetical protein